MIIHYQNIKARRHSHFLVLVDEDIVCLVTNPPLTKPNKPPLNKTTNKKPTPLPKSQISNIKFPHALRTLSINRCLSNHSVPNPFRINKLHNNPTTHRTMNMKTLTRPITTRKNNPAFRNDSATGTYPNRPLSKNKTKCTLNCINMPCWVKQVFDFTHSHQSCASMHNVNIQPNIYALLNNTVHQCT
jgi:hypothetical protein